VTLPAVAGKPYDQAVADLVAAGIKAENIQRVDQPSQDVAAGNVIGTQPADKVTTDQKLQVLVSTGPAKVAVPSVVNLTQEGAERALQNAGFQVIVKSAELKPGDAGGVGRVVDQWPEPGDMAEQGAEVTIVIGTQPATTTTTPTTSPPFTTTTRQNQTTSTTN
jgi:serine/threonine-protein kinase